MRTTVSNRSIGNSASELADNPQGSASKSSSHASSISLCRHGLGTHVAVRGSSPSRVAARRCATYQRLKAALDRLQSTTVATSLGQPTERRMHRFF